jgi:putative aldouronate transport system substrate-binding protein
MKKALPMLLIACMAAGTVACSKKADNGDAAAAPEGGNKKDETVTYQMFRNFSAPDYPEDGGPGKKILLDAMAKAGITGVDYKVELTSGSEYYTKLNLKASAGQLPDMFQPDYPTFLRMADEGLLLPLNDYLNKSPHIKKLIDQRKLDYVTVDGKIYAIPTGTRPEPYNLEERQGYIYRQDWLDKLGLKLPTTLDEMYNVLKAFTNNDPDGNGKKDTFGLTADKDNAFNGIFGAYGVIPTFWHERNGKIVKGFTLPETKEALATLQKWYKEGLIDPQFLVTESKQRNENIINSKYGVIQYSPLELDPNSAMLNALLKATPTAKFGFTPGPKGPNGKSGFPEATPINQIRAVSAKVKDPDKLFRMLDWMQNDDGGFNLVHYGVEGVDHKFDKATDHIEQISSYPELYKKGFSNPIRFLNDVDIRWAIPVVVDNMKKLIGTQIENEFWKPVPAELDYPDLEKKLWKEYFAKIVTGEYSVDKWDEFVQKYYKQGGEVIEKQANEEWNKMKAAKK